MNAKLFLHFIGVAVANLVNWSAVPVRVGVCPLICLVWLFYKHIAAICVCFLMYTINSFYLLYSTTFLKLCFNGCEQLAMALNKNAAAVLDFGLLCKFVYCFPTHAMTFSGIRLFYWLSILCALEGEENVL